LIQTRVDRFLSSPQCVDVGMIGGQAGRHLGTLGNGAVAGDQDIDVPGGLTQPVECRPSAGSGVRRPISSRGMPDALSAAIFCACSRASPAAWAPSAVA